MPGPFQTLLLASLLVGVSAVDLHERVVPDRMLLAWVALALPAAVCADPGDAGVRVGWAVVGGGALLGAHLLRPDGLGLGDVKLAAVIGFAVGPHVVAALALALLGGAAFGLVLVVRHGRSAMGMTIAFAPWMAAGTAVALLAGA